MQTYRGGGRGTEILRVGRRTRFDARFPDLEGVDCRWGRARRGLVALSRSLGDLPSRPAVDRSAPEIAHFLDLLSPPFFFRFSLIWCTVCTLQQTMKLEMGSHRRAQCCRPFHLPVLLVFGCFGVARRAR